MCCAAGLLLRERARGERRRRLEQTRNDDGDGSVERGVAVRESECGREWVAFIQPLCNGLNVRHARYVPQRNSFHQAEIFFP